MENAKIKNLKTWAPGKIDYPGAHVFQNAIFFYFSRFEIINGDNVFFKNLKIQHTPLKKIQK